MAISASSSHDRAEQMLVLTSRLTGLLERETELFLGRKPQMASEFADEKNQLARIYRNETARISKNPELLGDLEDGIKADLREATIKFNEALSSNHQASGAIRKITEGIVKSVASEVASKRAHPTGYGASGAAAQSTGNTMAAITLNKQV